MLRNSLKVILQKRTPLISMFSTKSDDAKKLKNFAEKTHSDDEREKERDEKVKKGVEKLGNLTRLAVPVGSILWGASKELAAHLDKFDPMIASQWIANHHTTEVFGVALLGVLCNIDYKNASEELQKAIVYVRYILGEAMNPENMKIFCDVLRKLASDEAYRSTILAGFFEALGIGGGLQAVSQVLNMWVGGVKQEQVDPFTTVVFEFLGFHGPAIGTLCLSREDQGKEFKVILNGPLLRIKGDDGIVRNTPAFVPNNWRFEPSKVRAIRGANRIVVYFPKSTRQMKHDIDVEIDVPFI